jgi:hypothetical protein
LPNAAALYLPVEFGIPSTENKNAFGQIHLRSILMKKLIVVAAVIFVMGVLVTGCASTPASALLGPGNYYSDVVQTGILRGEATSKVWFGVFGKETYPPVERVAKDNGIKKIATVEHYAKLGILSLWIDYTTIVTGE